MQAPVVTEAGETTGVWRWREIPRRLLYALVGAALSTGAPIGLLLVRSARRRHWSIPGFSAEIAGDLWTYVYVSVSTGIVFTLFGHVLGRHADRLLELSMTEPLTRLHNARVFHERLRQELARAVRHGQSLSLLLIDVDGLKGINDRHGHRAGDAALRRVAEAIRSQLRATDLGARWGGDEFAILAPGTSARAALVVAERVRAMVAQDGGGRNEPGITASVGVATLDPTHPDASAEALLAQADQALYEAKRKGRNRVVLGAQDSPLAGVRGPENPADS
jgi:diguanylate cyclase (GGDEF)-like protein